MEKLSSISGLTVSQQKEWGEILSGFETKNKYVISDTSGNRMYLAAEEAGSTLLRLFLKALRPFSLVVLTGDGEVVLIPKKSTRPIMVAYIKFSDSQEAEKSVREIVESMKWDLYHVLRIEWDVEKKPGVEVVIE